MCTWGAGKRTYGRFRVDKAVPAHSSVTPDFPDFARRVVEDFTSSQARTALQDERFCLSYRPRLPLGFVSRGWLLCPNVARSRHFPHLTAGYFTVQELVQRQKEKQKEKEKEKRKRAKQRKKEGKANAEAQEKDRKVKRSLRPSFDW